MIEKTITVDLPEDLYKEFQTYVFNKRMEEHPNSKTTIKATVAKAITEFLSRNTNEKRRAE